MKQQAREVKQGFLRHATEAGPLYSGERLQDVNKGSYMFQKHNVSAKYGEWVENWKIDPLVT